MISSAQIITLLPMIIIGLTVVILMLSIAYRRNLFLHTVLTIFGFSAAIASLRVVWHQSVRDVAQFMCIDNFAILYIILILVSSLASAILAYKWLLYYPKNCDEFYLLLLVSSIGGMVLTTASHLVILFLGIELISLPLFGLIGYSFFKKFSLEASIKYIILSGVSSSFILFGIALIYAATGSLSFSSISNVLHMHSDISVQPIMLIIVGFGMIMVGLGFKLSLVPFHLWTPDIYQGAPPSVSLYITSVGKVAIISVLIRLLMMLPNQYSKIFCTFLSGAACCSVLFGNLMAIGQNNIKRMLAYSSIAHVGYISIGVIAATEQINPMALEILSIYLISYLLASIGAFGVITKISVCCSVDKDSDILFTYRGLFWYQPVLSVMFTIIMLSLAGVPMTLGFISKFYLFILGINSQLWWLTVFVAINSIIGIFYYLRIIINLYLNSSSDRVNIYSGSFFSWMNTCDGMLVVFAVFLVLFLGLYPQPIITFIHTIHPVLSPIV